MSSTSPAADASAKRGGLPADLIVSALATALACLLAWLWLLRSSDAMGGHDMADMMAPDPWSAAYLASAFIMWALMMVAMMLPSALPMILLRARIDRAPAGRARLLNSALFVGSYILVWAVFSAAAAILQAASLSSGLIGAMSLRLGEPALAAALLFAAAAYQLSPTKRTCLDRCQSPLHFVLRYWRPGPAGSVRLGIAHGLFCLGCCWALMLLLFVGGVMSIAWIAGLALVVLAEKLAPPSWRLDRAVALLLALAGAALLA